LYIAKEGLTAPLPPGWKANQNEEGDVYYCNLQTSKSQWEHPLDDLYREKYQKAKEKKEASVNRGGKLAPLDKKDGKAPLRIPEKRESMPSGMSPVAWVIKC
jgi:centrosomal protein CEP164